jgi:hypothetical protein
MSVRLVLLALVGVLFFLPSMGSAAWPTDGVLLDAAGSFTDHLRAVPDGRGGAIMVWQKDGDIYAERIDAGGFARWIGNGFVCGASGPQSDPDAVSDGQGGVIVVWRDDRSDPNGDIYAQRLDAAGNALWTPDGVALVTGPSRNDSGNDLLQIVSDGTGGAILSFSDNRNADGSLDPNFGKVWVQHVDAQGNPAWGNGVVAGNAVYAHGNHDLISDGSGGVVVAWQDGSSFGNWNISAQRFDALGNPLWGVAGVLACAASGAQTVPDLAADGAGGAVVVWRDDRSDPNGDIYAQRLDAAGNALWTSDGVALVTGPSRNDSGDDLLQVVTDGTGGAILSFSDNRNADNSLDPSFGKVWVQRVDAQGNPAWGNGVVAGNAVYAHGNHELVADGSGGAVVTWQDGSSFGDWNINAQHFAASGETIFTPGGGLVCKFVGQQTEPAICSDGHGGAIAAWLDTRTGPADIYLNRICGLGTVVDTGPNLDDPASRAFDLVVTNPVRRTLTYGVRLSGRSALRLRLIDAAGRSVAEVNHSMVVPGWNHFSWEGASRLPSGIYFLHGESMQGTVTRKVVILR